MYVPLQFVSNVDDMILYDKKRICKFSIYSCIDSLRPTITVTDIITVYYSEDLNRIL
jgi:hypothetical protein